MKIDDEIFYANLIIYAFGILSCISLLLIILVFFYQHKKQKVTPAFELIFYLCIASLINTISFMILYIPDLNELIISPVLCKTQGALIFFSELSQYIVATMISIFIFSIKSKDEFYDNFPTSRRVLYLGGSFGIASIFTLILLYYDSFGENRNRCWIKNENDGWLIYLDCIIIWILIIINCVLALIIYCKKFKNYINEEIRYRIDFSNKLSLYPIVSFICWFISSLTSYFDYEDKDIQFLDIISLIFNLLEGFLYASVSMYFFSFRKKIKKILKNFSFWKKKKQSLDLNINENFFEEKTESSKISFKSCYDNSLNKNALK